MKYRIIERNDGRFELEVEGKDGQWHWKMTENNVKIIKKRMKEIAHQEWLWSKKQIIEEGDMES